MVELAMPLQVLFTKASLALRLIVLDSISFQLDTSYSIPAILPVVPFEEDRNVGEGTRGDGGRGDAGGDNESQTRSTWRTTCICIGALRATSNDDWNK